MILFSKMQGTGNDFVVINCITQYFNYSLNTFAKYLCNRNFGVGADGVIYLFKSSIADFKMRIFNSDGTEAGMCGNGIRCLAKYLYEKNVINRVNFRIETISGVKDINLIVENKTVIGIKVNMGIPFFEAQRIPAYLPKEEYSKKYHTVSINIEAEEYKFDLVSVGNPHAVCFVEDLSIIDICRIGKIVENHKYFPNKINVEFVQIIDKSNIKIKVWERGVGNTISCGTGACASVICAIKRSYVETNVDVELDGGKLHIDYSDNEKGIIMTGGAEFVFEGRIDL